MEINNKLKYFILNNQEEEEGKKTRDMSTRSIYGRYKEVCLFACLLVCLFVCLFLFSMNDSATKERTLNTNKDQYILGNEPYLLEWNILYNLYKTWHNNVVFILLLFLLLLLLTSIYVCVCICIYAE